MSMEDAASPNLPELSVSELSSLLKRTVEDRFALVRVRGEMSGVKRHSSGHLYFALKDVDAVLDGVAWRNVAGRLKFRPEDGLEVVVTGRLTTYPGRSKYQIVAESLEPAGVGALMALLEERKRKLAAEGLFAPERKRALPFLPGVIGVVTSPTGAVIRDILHRLADRFPRHVLVWPVAVQGDGAAEQVARAIAGFNAIAPGGPVPRPDLLIVARGGGSLEDLWAFNEEAVVRAAAASRIPLISAVGHETDTTLIDFASDRRAPTPTAAAEMAVPVRAELLDRVEEMGARARQAARRLLAERATRLDGLARGLRHPKTLIEAAEQRLDDLGERLPRALLGLIGDRRRQLAEVAGGLRDPRQQIAAAEQRLGDLGKRLPRALLGLIGDRRRLLAEVAGGLRPTVLQSEIRQRGDRLTQLAERLSPAMRRAVEAGERRLATPAQLLESLGYHRVLARGYAVVRRDGKLATAAAALGAGDALEIEFADGKVAAVATGSENPPRRRPRKTETTPPEQGTLI
ncbi:exodeoxyribonuclease VII large subunit [Zavarzinia compransoris]|uniref:Exodeoxyribonuclease 7 large subunit n=1 Tax=Zavarzinia compransoris TaxID=1264899 RepID=A0A317E8U8_9PROT|nr:exodeoxyribonuclease VII large subunit [Zavarzinia compransoris]PWR23547.1 exodeoxyribonuclease VII large subunit [Zavarzinia compransoris]TDP47758.1 exodeoxyribonuclease VII large subunit [Zavarzinia compransoris]